MSGVRYARCAMILTVLLGATPVALAPPFRPPPRPPVRPAPRPPIVRPPVGPGITPRPSPLLPVRPPPRPSPRPPASVSRNVQVQVKGLVRTQPVEALTRLAGREGTFLSRAARVRLGREAVEHLAKQVESAPDAGKVLVEARQAQGRGGALDPALKRTLEGVVRVAEKQAVSHGLEEVVGLTGKGQLGEAGARAGQWLQALEGVAGPKGFRESLGQLSKAGEQARALDAVEAGLKGTGGAESLTHSPFRGLRVQSLPESLRGPVEGLQALAEVRVQAGQPWKQSPDVALLRNSVARFEKAVGPDDPRLGKSLLQDLAVKALVEGHPQAFRELMPRDGPPGHAANLLRDLKAMALGEGKVSTWPAEQALAGRAVPGAQGPRGPPTGLEPLIPEGARQGWRPPVRESARADLPPLAKARQAGQQLEAKVEAGMKAERAELGKQGEAAHQRLVGIRQQWRGAQAQLLRQRQAVESELKRKLRPDERALAALLAEQGKDVPQIVEELKHQPEEDEEGFLEEVERLLGRELEEEERNQAVRLRGEGRKAGEVAIQLIRLRVEGKLPAGEGK